MAETITSENGLFRKTAWVIAAVAVVLPVLGGVLSGTPVGLSPYLANIIGQIATFSMLAIALDLIWGYAGILSLGHGLFFAMGGYLVAMHLLKAGFTFGGITPDFMVFMGWSEFPAYWAGFEYFPYALGLIVALPGLLALIYGFVSFRSRVSGVYFAIISQALTYIAMLLMFRNDTGFGGNNGMTGFSQVLGVPIGSDAAIVGMASASVLLLLATFLASGWLMRTAFGRVLVALRDDEARLRFLGYETLWPKLAIWTLSAVIAALAGALYVPQVGIINPRLLSPDVSIEIAVWVALGGRGTLSGAVIGAVIISGLKFWLSGFAPDLWPFILAAVVLVVVVALPNGLLDLPQVLRERMLGRLSAKRMAEKRHG
ncbi:amino acid/amide ABC transporter membrane protein 2 (HAAT family) [Rhodobacter sp. 140A]|jgi:urea transport system permease protein|uniref:Urea ABC transporter permease subunit UrtC n=1 Tax=bioreactor metagenome TaxID=1076179 RepID=A0A644WLM0_9ZZZZ|nr:MULTISPECIES: urea ABC transporter permease subunit UrtC [Thioclava]MAQ38455.1 urea ABC transporter permease subunit UrtC [Thioclava sp.]RBP84951.1 amino acid/amide ABC transporter membrane protein 2 (HAAT family) [Rhodobacter sp. 140A]|tara:strand:- start:726 stop:1841 length:1116 start_codon:yes stop_codon:yes gene_type:complete